MLKRSGFKKRPVKPMKRTPLRRKSKSKTSTQKDDIQAYVREIVILRDGGCVLRGKLGHQCSGCRKDGELILQADHLIERSNSATYADTRLIVCVCKGLHCWKHFKKSNHDEYNRMIKSVLSKERISLWERCEKDDQSHKTKKMDWAMELVALKQELEKYKLVKP